jgi:hypothetical protein
MLLHGHFSDKTFYVQVDWMSKDKSTYRDESGFDKCIGGMQSSKLNLKDR